MIKYDVQAKGVKEMVGKLKDVDVDLVKALRSDLRTEVSSTASFIKAQIGAMPAPLSGMAEPGNKAYWGGVTARAAISLSNTKKITPLLAIKMNSAKGAPGYLIAETAGKKSRGNTPQGQNLIAVLTDRLGSIRGKSGNRIAWKMFSSRRAELRKAALGVLDSYSRKVSVELNK
jgi:hypothetical protein